MFFVGFKRSARADLVKIAAIATEAVDDCGRDVLKFSHATFSSHVMAKLFGTRSI